ncbi:e3 ubiquitin-protein ligase mycbp2 [Holotrichia oblita]|uniref:E3 ubiquitin-protein ligase mycbp2 n=1 Tax=Holotrichia oblita TaxID=644536 RepID=A0ACB9TWU5_HOLOL|nr:e3 ubiquitin-protein ligase mycbp2 [Holotrichia oblita]
MAIVFSGTGQESSARRGSNQSDTSALVSSITRDISQSPSQATQPRDLSPSPSGSSLHTRSETSPPRTPVKKETVQEPEVSQRVLTQTGTQTSPETSNIAAPVKGHFSIGTGNKEERVSPKMTRKDRSSSKSRSKRAISPANAPHFSSTSKVNYPGNEPIKQAVSPSVAEAMRAVFAAFLWHEGIVHDAMACASFLKFHPTLPKQGALVVTRHGPSDTPVDKRRQELTKEERARQRHSVEVANAGNYLHIQPSTLESLTRSAANASANRNRGNRKTPDNIIKEDQLSDANFGYHTISVLPPALKCLVYLWEELTGNCIQALAQQLIASSPVYPKAKKFDKAVAKNEAKDKTVTVDKETKKRETICELCGVTYPHPVTYHMRQAHPGCGHHAGSKGYSPSGNYCRGWAGNCGNGGVHGSTWYLLCESCREKYVKTNRGGKAYVPKAVDKTISRRKTTILLNSPMSIEAHGISEAHIIMKNNATFLLDLASASETNLSRQRRPSSSIMPSVSENNSPPDYVGPFSPAPPFQCLQSLGADPNINEAQFYEEVLRRQRGADGNFLGPSTTGQRPLSEVSLSDDTDSTKGLRFHRSVSMGTNGVPWSKTGLDGRIIMMRKRNNSSSEMANESGSSLLCNPSPTLLKLVPKMDSSAIVSNNQSDNSICSEGQADDFSLMQRPTMRFLLQQHDLESLQLAMKQALRSEEIEDTTISMHESALNQVTCLVESLKDLTQYIEIKASSRLAMIGSLTDGSTETFWESGDEDRNKTKILTIICAHGHHPKLICVHIDNCRDLANKISTITFFSGPNSEELVKLRTVEVETRLLGGWVNCPIQGTQDSIIRLEMKGPDNSVRVRQIRVLGEIDGESLKVGKQYNATTIQQRNCESETLRVFRLITSQVFGKLVLVDPDSQNVNMNNLDSGSVSASESLEPLEESNDLREHMVGILFSRSKLTHLQKQVIVHIVQAIRKEAMRVKEDWEVTLCMGTAGSASSGQSQDATKNTDTYCFEMLSMVLALSGSSVGRAYLSHQGGLLSDLLSLLHTGSARVQRQVTALLKRMLPEISPESFAKAMSIESLPPKDFSIVAATSKGVIFDTHRAGILDVLLSVIAKSLTVQIKAKGKTNSGSNLKELNTVTLATSIHPKDNMCSRWWLRGYVSRKLAEVIVHLIKDMASGKLSEAWGNVTKAAIAQNILNLTQLSEDHRIPSICLRTPTLWLALASLCVLDKDHVERLSSGQWTKADGQPTPPRPTCTNHDDGETNAVIQCSLCGNLCADCDRFLHLHRKTRNHQRQVCKEEEEAIKVELHEGCGRTKLFWLLAVADARTLKALVEYREGSARHRGVGTSGQCRFCGAVGSSGLLAIGNVCADQECQEYARTACTKLLTCGHMCGGVQGEFDCLPCLHGCSSDTSLRQDADDMCMICFTEALSCAPAVQLRCGHVFHLHCCKTVLMKRWAGPRITFSFSLCPICKSNMDHDVLRELLAPIQELFNDVQRKALLRLEYEGLLATDAVATPGGRFYNNAAAYAMDRYAYYVCYKCNKAYYGGEARCDAEVSENYDPTELVCGGCSDVARAQMCPKHGTDFLEYKCRYCCSVAVFFCFGTTHFCNPCHDDFQRVTNLPKNELPQCPAGPKAKQLDGEECPLHVKHPPTGEEFALGCGVCRNAHTF